VISAILRKITETVHRRILLRWTQNEVDFGLILERSFKSTRENGCFWAQDLKNAVFRWTLSEDPENGRFTLIKSKGKTTRFLLRKTLFTSVPEVLALHFHSVFWVFPDSRFSGKSPEIRENGHLRRVWKWVRIPRLRGSSRPILRCRSRGITECDSDLRFHVIPLLGPASEILILGFTRSDFRFSAEITKSDFQISDFPGGNQRDRFRGIPPKSRFTIYVNHVKLKLESSKFFKDFAAPQVLMLLCHPPSITTTSRSMLC